MPAMEDLSAAQTIPVSTFAFIKNSIGYGEFNYAYNISLVNKYVYIENAKSACTTVKSSLGAAELKKGGLGQIFADKFTKNVHTNILGTPFVKPYQMGRHYFDDVLTNPRYKIFTFVKNPYTRILSAYLDKVQRKLPECIAIYETAGKKPEEDELSFLEFLLALQTQLSQGRVPDKHFRSQALQCGQGHLRLDFIGKVENFEADFQHITSEIGFTAAPLILGVGHSTKAKTVLADHYGTQEAELLYQLFQADFEMFGYDPDIQTLLQACSK